MAGADEELLSGGLTNAGLVSRVGDTVRRPWRPTSAATHALLEHLERVGFGGAPRFLGADEHGREVLSYVPGQAAIEPYADWALSDEALAGVAQLLRRYHDAVASFDHRLHVWRPGLPAAFVGPIVSHNDPNLDNVIFRDGRAVALIDFDLAAPGTVVWDVACAARLWAPLRAEADRPQAVRGRALARLRTFADAYGLPAADRARVVEILPHAHAWCYDVVRAAVTGGHPTFERMWHGGGKGKSDRTHRWLVEQRRPMRAALGVP